VFSAAMGKPTMGSIGIVVTCFVSKNITKLFSDVMETPPLGSIRYAFIIHVATNNIKVFSATMESKKWVLLVLLYVCHISTNNIRVFSDGMEMPTMESFRLLLSLGSYQQYKSFQCCYGKANNEFYSYCCISTMQLPAIKDCLVLPSVTVFICHVDTNNIEVVRAVMEKPTIGNIRRVVYHSCSNQQFKRSRCCHGNIKKRFYWYC
jgi:hypothetical protein